MHHQRTLKPIVQFGCVGHVCCAVCSVAAAVCMPFTRLCMLYRESCTLTDTLNTFLPVFWQNSVLGCKYTPYILYIYYCKRNSFLFYNIFQMKEGKNERKNSDFFALFLFSSSSPIYDTAYRITKKSHKIFEPCIYVVYCDTDGSFFVKYLLLVHFQLLSAVCCTTIIYYIDF